MGMARNFRAQLAELVSEANVKSWTAREIP